MWRAFVTPYAPETGTPNPAATVEARADVPLPMRLTIKARYDRKRKQAVVTGTFSAPVIPGVFDLVGIPLGICTRHYRRCVNTKTRKGGKFNARMRISATTIFVAQTGGVFPDCFPQASPAPAGCVSETLASAFAAPAKAIVKKR